MAHTPFNPNYILGPGMGRTGYATKSLLPATTSKFAFRYVPANTETWTAFSIRFSKNGNGGSQTVNIRIQTEASGIPSGTDVTNGVISALAPTASQWYKNNAFPSTGAVLTGKTPYWIVVESNSGGDASNNYGCYLWNDFQKVTNYQFQTVQYTVGTGWAATPATYTAGGGWLATLSDSTTVGNPCHAISNFTFSATVRLGNRFYLDVQATIRGVNVFTGFAATTVGSFEVNFYKDDGTFIDGPFTFSKNELWGAQTSTSPQAIILDFGKDVVIPVGWNWASFHQVADGAASTWLLQAEQEDYDTGTLLRSGANCVGTRTNDSSAWTMQSIPSVGYLNLVASGLTAPPATGGCGIFTSVVLPKGPLG